MADKRIHNLQIKTGNDIPDKLYILASDENGKTFSVDLGESTNKILSETMYDDIENKNKNNLYVMSRYDIELMLHCLNIMPKTNE